MIVIPAIKYYQDKQNEMKKVKADFEAEVIKRDVKSIMIIVDENLGNMSVTNDIENVVEYVAERFQVDPNDTLVVYRDTEGLWDGWNHKRQRFIHLGVATREEAIQEIIQKHKNNNE